MERRLRSPRGGHWIIPDEENTTGKTRRAYCPRIFPGKGALMVRAKILAWSFTGRKWRRRIAKLLLPQYKPMYLQMERDDDSWMDKDGDNYND
jgi:hypothetical protein